MKPIGLGIIGCGIAARELHRPALGQMRDRFSIAAVCNHTEPKARSFSELTGGTPWMLDYHELLAHPGVEAVAIALPYHLNLEVTRAALEAGKHVIVEKPLALDLNEADAMVTLANAHPDLVTLVAENFRYRPLYRRAAELVASGELGDPYFLTWDYFFFVDPEENQYAQTPWRMDQRYGGGFIVDAGVHSVAAIRDIAGDFTAVQGLVTGVTPALGRLDTLSLQFETTRGIRGVLNLFYSVKGHRANTMRIFGDRATVIVERHHLVVEREHRDPVREEYPDDMGYAGEYDNFHDAIRKGSPVISTFEKAGEDLRSILGGLEAAEKGKRLVMGR